MNTRVHSEGESVGMSMCLPAPWSPLYQCSSTLSLHFAKETLWGCGLLSPSLPRICFCWLK